MTLRDLLLVLGAVPLLGVVALRLAAEMGFSAEVPPPDALPATLAAFGVVFLVYVALTLRAIARATREILAREGAAPIARDQTQPKAAVSDFAIHLDRSAEVDLCDPDADEDLQSDLPARAPQAPRTELFGKVSNLLTRIPSARSR